MSTVAATPRTATAPSASRAASGPRRPGTALAAVASLTRTNLVSFVREPVGFVMQFLYPLFMLGIFNAVFTGYILRDVTYAQYLLPSMLTTGILTTCLQNVTISVAGERETGALKRLAVQPVPTWAHVVSKCISNALLAIANAIMLIAVAHYAMDVALPTDAGAWGLLALTTALMVAVCTALGLAIGRTRPTSRAASGLITPIVLILQFVSGIFFPLAQLPKWMVTAASILPARWSAELMRAGLLPDSFAAAEPTGAWETGKGLAIVVAWLVIGIVAAIVITRRDTVDR